MESINQLNFQNQSKPATCQECFETIENGDLNAHLKTENHQSSFHQIIAPEAVLLHGSLEEGKLVYKMDNLDNVRRSYYIEAIINFQLRLQKAIKAQLKMSLLCSRGAVGDKFYANKEIEIQTQMITFSKVPKDMNYYDEWQADINDQIEDDLPKSFRLKKIISVRLEILSLKR